MSNFEVPLLPQPQKFSIAVAGQEYNLRFTWCDPQKAWIMDIADNQKLPLVQGIPLVTGADLLESYEYLEFGFKMYALTEFAVNTPPTFENLGSTGHLYVVTP